MRNKINLPSAAVWNKVHPETAMLTLADFFFLIGDREQEYQSTMTLHC